MNRREFFKGMGWMGFAAATAGCRMNRFGFGLGAPMADFAVPPLKRVRIGFVGVGSRGSYAVRRICQIPGVEIAAICDISEAVLAKRRDHLNSVDMRKMGVKDVDAGPQQDVGSNVA